MENRVLEKFHAGDRSLGTFTHLLSAPAIEALAYTGLDYVIIDMEHSIIAAEHAAELVGVAAGAGIAPFVRVDAIQRSPVLKMLDAGAALGEGTGPVLVGTDEAFDETCNVAVPGLNTTAALPPSPSTAAFLSAVPPLRPQIPI